MVWVNDLSQMMSCFVMDGVVVVTKSEVSDAVARRFIVIKQNLYDSSW